MDQVGGTSDSCQNLSTQLCFAQRNSLKFGWLRREGLGSERTDSESYKPCGTLGQRILLRPGVTIGIAVTERRLVRSMMGRRRGLAVSQHSTKVGIQIEYMIWALFWSGKTRPSGSSSIIQLPQHNWLKLGRNLRPQLRAKSSSSRGLGNLRQGGSVGGRLCPTLRNSHPSQIRSVRDEATAARS